LIDKFYRYEQDSLQIAVYHPPGPFPRLDPDDNNWLFGRYVSGRCEILLFNLLHFWYSAGWYIASNCNVLRFPAQTKTSWL